MTALLQKASEKKKFYDQRCSPDDFDHRQSSELKFSFFPLQLTQKNNFWKEKKKLFSDSNQYTAVQIATHNAGSQRSSEIQERHNPIPFIHTKQYVG